MKNLISTTLLLSYYVLLSIFDHELDSRSLISLSVDVDVDVDLDLDVDVDGDD